MEYNKQKYDSNEKLVLNIGIGFLIGSIALFILTVMMIENFEFLLLTFQVIATIGVIGSAVMVVTGNIRVVRYLFIIKKQDSKAIIWKSSLTVLLAFISLFVSWLVLILLVFQSL